MVIFTIVVYISAKIPVAALQQVRSSAGDAAIAGMAVARPWAMALLASFCGLSVGIFFLSFTYHYVLWIYVGLSGALYSSIRTHLPTFRVRFGWRDFAMVAGLDVATVGLVRLYTGWVLG